MRVQKIIVPIFLLTLLAWGGRAISVGFAAESKPADEVATNDPTILKIAQDYSTYRKVTNEPVRVNSAITASCVVFFGGDRLTEESIRRYGPHANSAILIFMNDRALAKSEGDFPVGSVIAKEKVGDTFGINGRLIPLDEKQRPVGGMVKREPGYDPENGDWEYFYFEDPAAVYSGRIASCIECHAQARDTDHVFGTWRNAGPVGESPPPPEAFFPQKE